MNNWAIAAVIILALVIGWHLFWHVFVPWRKRRFYERLQAENQRRLRQEDNDLVYEQYAKFLPEAEVTDNGDGTYTHTFRFDQ